jgi:hypothetical protein
MQDDEDEGDKVCRACGTSFDTDDEFEEHKEEKHSD